ncbi:hypothetical protein J1G42_08975 [Cellulomonas sp. zg-ZUI222]|uniref:GerMN domain-containing protein n=1 Tax=Cellulomonas wangleii TaxID=2816956 RepID=A0ABX8D0K2_9CELL|nr:MULTISPECIES: hypothetical protein [Cellulomonas]MBO0900128.1 hypothetical protein [Cellulomonas sp. zg-ZUI22]MBO0920957.1 hypothetical protein [Cellulomonas wangleii]MBO0925561.1 hypothetical protein [Cellulomonas wangleii]QVI60975.1 hypothetical protein KG103_10570 [Cellulomonas wangleii]
MPRPTTPALVAALALGTVLSAGCTTTPGPTPTSSPSAASATPTPGEPLLTDDITEDSAVGTLAPGFPTDLVPVPPDAEILVSSAEPVTDGVLRISLNVRTGQDTAALLDAVRAPLVGAGFAEAPPAVPEPGLAAQTTFARSDGAELVVVGILDRDGLRTMTLGGTVGAPAP